MAALRCHVWCRGLRAQRLARLTRPCSVLKAAWETLNLAPALGGKRQCGQGGCLCQSALLCLSGKLDTSVSGIYTHAVRLQLKAAVGAISWQAATAAQCMLAAW